MQASTTHTNLRSGAAGRQAGSAHSLTAMASKGDDIIPAAAAAATAAGGLPGTSKRPASPGGAADEDGKRQRLASHAAAGPSGSSGDPLDAVPDAPMHLMRVRGIPACVCVCLLFGCGLPHGHARHCSARQPSINRLHAQLSRCLPMEVTQLPLAPHFLAAGRTRASWAWGWQTWCGAQ